MKVWWLAGLVICWSVLTVPVAFGQSVHDHNQFHGLAQTIQPNLPQGTEGLFIEFRWRNQANADVDGHVQLPAGVGPYNVTQTINFSRADQPFAGGPQNQRIYPSQSGVRFNNNAAFAFHSGDQGGGAPVGVGCVEPNGGSCEVVAITGQVPTATYGVGIHNFNFFNIPNSTADYEVIAYANNGRVVINGGSSHLTTNSISGTNLQTGQSQIASVDYIFTGNSPHAVGVNDLISTEGFGIGVDQLQTRHVDPVESYLNVAANSTQSLVASMSSNVPGQYQRINHPIHNGVYELCNGINCYVFRDENAKLTLGANAFYAAELAKGAGAYFLNNPGEVLSDSANPIQTQLDVYGVAPVIGIPADALNASISAARGNYTEAGATAFGMIPGYGDAVQAGRLGIKYSDNVSDAVDALPQGIIPRAGTRVRPSGIPSNWRISNTRSTGGTLYSNPEFPNQTVRVMQGNPNSPYPNSRNPYVRMTDRNGNYLDRFGNIAPNRSEATHIPLNKFSFPFK